MKGTLSAGTVPTHQYFAPTPSTKSYIHEDDGLIARMATTSVLYAHRCDAKALKSRLEQESLLDKRFRMTPSASDATVVLPSNNHHHEEGSGVIDAIVSGRCIAVPVIDECIDRLNKAVRKHTKNTSDKDSSWETYIVAYGRQSCPFSTSTLGNQNHVVSSRLVQQQQKNDVIIE